MTGVWFLFKILYFYPELHKKFNCKQPITLILKHDCMLHVMMGTSGRNI